MLLPLLLPCNHCFKSGAASLDWLPGSLSGACRPPAPAPAVVPAGEHPVQPRAGPPLRVPDIDQGQALQYLASLGVPPTLREEVRRVGGDGVEGGASGRCVTGQAVCCASHFWRTCQPASLLI